MDAVERMVFIRGRFVVRADSGATEVVRALMAAGALVLTHSEADEGAVTLKGQRHDVATAQEVQVFLTEDGILRGEATR